MKGLVTLSYWHRTGRETSHHDVVVIGGGITGCSIAYWLKRWKPSLSVAIVERGPIAWGASGRNAGFLLQGGSGDFLADRKTIGEDRLHYIWELTGENIDLVENEINADAVQFRRTGSYFCTSSEADMEDLQRTRASLLDWHIDVEFRDAHRLEEEIRARGFASGLYFPGNATVHPVRLVRYVAKASGAHVFDHQPVIEIEPGSNANRLHTPLNTFDAPRVVVAANAHTPLLLPETANLIRPVRAQMYATAPQKRRLFHPVYSHHGFYYVRQLDDGRVLAGGARHLHLQDEIGYGDAWSHAVQQDIAAYIRQHFPWAGASITDYRWSGTMGFSPDGMPLVSECVAIPGVMWVGGFSGHGMAYGMALGKRIAEYLLGLSDECMRYFSAERFTLKGES